MWLVKNLLKLFVVILFVGELILLDENAFEKPVLLNWFEFAVETLLPNSEWGGEFNKRVGWNLFGSFGFNWNEKTELERFDWW